MNTLPEILGVEDEHIRRLLDNHAADIHCCMPGIVQSFNGTGTVTVLIAVKERVLQEDMTYKNTQFPILVDVPIIMQRAGGFSARMKPVKGDECLVMFSDIGIDWWWQNGGCQNKTQDLRRHDLSDGFAILGPWSSPRNFASYPDSFRIGKDDETAYIEITPSGQINIVGPVHMSNTLDVAGNTHLEAQLTADGTTTIQGKPFLPHEHSGVQKGSGVTGGVV